MVLISEANDVPAGCAILQEQPDETTLSMDYKKRSLSSAERMLKTTKRECLVVVWEVLLKWVVRVNYEMIFCMPIFIRVWLTKVFCERV